MDTEPGNAPEHDGPAKKTPPWWLLALGFVALVLASIAAVSVLSGSARGTGAKAGAEDFAGGVERLVEDKGTPTESDLREVFKSSVEAPEDGRSYAYGWTVFAPGGDDFVVCVDYVLSNDGEVSSQNSGWSAPGEDVQRGEEDTVCGAKPGSYGEALARAKG